MLGEIGVLIRLSWVGSCKLFSAFISFGVKATNLSTFFFNNRGYVKPKQGLVKFAVRLKGKNVEVRIATSLKNVKERNEEADGMSDIQ